VLYADYYISISIDITYPRLFFTFYILIGIFIWVFYFLNRKIYFLPALLILVIMLYFQVFGILDFNINLFWLYLYISIAYFLFKQYNTKNNLQPKEGKK